MGYLDAVDISQWQGAYKDYGTPIVFMKASGGDAGVYLDSQLFGNYAGAKSQGKGIGLYHFAGGKDPVVEANYFLRACAPLEENDVLVLDWEVAHPNPVEWCRIFMETVHATCGVWPLIYINLATLRAYDWTPVLTNCGLWIAAWTGDPNSDINTGGHPYVVHQYRGAPLDLDAVWLTMDQFHKFGYHVKTDTPVPTPAPAPVAPTPITPPVVIPTPPIVPTPVVPTPTPIKPPVIKKPIWWNAMLAWLRRHNMKVVKK
jgi:hypothetical protein